MTRSSFFRREPCGNRNLCKVKKLDRFWVDIFERPQVGYTVRDMLERFQPAYSADKPKY
jgi:hypothetical protein